MGPLFEKVPEPLSKFHIICLIISSIVFVFAFIFAKKRSDKKESREGRCGWTSRWF